jgi:predicted permease
MLHDLKYAVRMFRTRTGFAAMVILVLALGIGINTAFFSVINEVLLRPIPWKDPDRIVSVWETTKGNNSNLVSAANFVEWRQQTASDETPTSLRVFERVAGWRFLYLNLTGRDEPERVQGLTVSPDFFPLLNVNAEIGRTFISEEEKPEHDKVVILSHRLWERRFAGDLTIIGQPITVEGEPYTVVGVLPSDFHIFRVLNRGLDVYVPLRLDPAESARLGTEQSKNSPDSEQVMFVYGRLADGVSIDQAQASMSAIYSGLEQQYSKSNSDKGVRLVRLRDQWTQQLRPTMLMLLLSIMFVLMISCANAANLLLARASVREKEMAVRAALGASRRRLVGQLLMESVMLAVAAGATGMMLALVGIKMLNRFIPYSVLNHANEFRVDTSVIGFTLIVSLATGVVFGLAPALQISRIDLSGSLKELAGNAMGKRLRGARLRNALIVTEIALAVTLLVAAGMMIRSVISLQTGNRGLNTENILTAQIFLPRAKYQGGADVSRVYREVLQKVQALPGVESAGLINYPPLGVISTTVPFEIRGQEPASADDTPTVQYSVISSEYFRTVNIPLLAGREFSDQDRDENHGVVIISANMAQRLWPNESPIGKQVTPRFPAMKAYWLPESNNVPLTIVGVVGDVNREGIAGTSPDQRLPDIYLPYLQNPSSIMHLVVRTPTDPLRWTAAIREAVYAIDKDQPVFDIKTLDEVVAESFARPRILMLILVAFAGLALSLAAAGIYGIVSYSVAQRTHEIGIRVALGAQRRDILRLVLRQVMSLSAAGLIVGSISGIVVTKMLASLLYGVSSTDPVPFGFVAVLLGVVAFVASYIPARRAMSVDPMIALRCQ